MVHKEEEGRQEEMRCFNNVLEDEKPKEEKLAYREEEDREERTTRSAAGNHDRKSVLLGRPST